MLNPAERETIAKIDQRALVITLQQLIRARSDYPPGDTRAAISVVRRRLSRWGIESQCFTKDPVRESLIAKIGNPDETPALIFHAHIDTIPGGDLEEWDHPPYEGVLYNNAIYGRGAVDDKGSVAAQLEAFIALAKSRALRSGHILLAVVADEESGGESGTRWLHDEGVLQPDYLVIGEQTNNHISIAERVACGIDLIVYGKSSHGATPWEGENAVVKASRALAYLLDELAPTLNARKHPYLPPPTLNVGKIFGGIQWNVVPQECRVEMDRRLIPGETREGAIQEIRAILDRYSDEIESLRYVLHSKGDVAQNIDTHPEHSFVETASHSLKEIAGERRPLIGYLMTSDGRWFADERIPIIHFGPGDPALAHATNESVPIEQLIEAARFLTLLGLRWHDKHATE